MLSKVQLALSKLLAPGEPLLVGVSGGADSVALLDVLVGQGWRPHVCHLNHQLRGADSDADAEFVRALAQRYGLPCTIESRKVEPNEDAARQARHEFFASVAARSGFHKLALAHTADDQVETFLLRLLRGSGVAGLLGMWPERRIGELIVIRPLLNVTRDEVLQYLSAQGLQWREDATNADRRFTRNRIRHELLPLLEREYNPGIRDVLLRTVEILRDEDAALSEQAEALVGETLEASTLRLLPVALQRRVIRAWLGELGFEHVEAVRQLALGAEVTLPGDWIVCREYDVLRKGTRDDFQPVRGRWPVRLDGETAIAELGIVLECADLSAFSGQPERQSGDKSPQSKECFDADVLGTDLFVRTWEKGDRFQPLGMSESKKLQDFFVDEKVPRLRRGRVPLLCAANGEIAWVVGHRIAEPFKVSERTRRVLGVRVERI